MFDPSYTRNPASPGGTGETIATMLLGYPIAIRRDVFVAGTATLHTKEMNFYVRDEWRVNSKFTANFGVHYEINTPFVEEKDQWVNFDPATGTQLIAGRNGVSRTGNINTDFTAFAPRISLAYQATSKTVIRSGVRSVLLSSGQRGYQHPPVPAASVRLRGQPAVLRQRYSTHYDFAGFPADDVAAGLDQGTGVLCLRGVTPDFRNGQMQQFNVSVQRELGPDMVATVGYVGSAGAKLYWARNINQPDPGPGAVDPRRPYAITLPGVTGITWLESSGNSFFSSLQTTFEKRFSKSFYFLGNWTWSHGLDNVGGDGGANGPIPQDPKNRRADWASSNSDVRHRVNLAASYQLPFGKGSVSLPAAAWSIRSSGDGNSEDLSVLQSGLPFTVTVPGSPSNTGASSRANPVPGVNPIPSNQNINLWFDPNAFATPPAYTWGTLGRNTLRAPALYNFDFSVARKIVFQEVRQLEFRTEFFNGLNHPQFGLPNSTAGVGGAGTITSTQRANRQIQFALRLTL